MRLAAVKDGVDQGLLMNVSGSGVAATSKANCSTTQQKAKQLV